MLVRQDGQSIALAVCVLHAGHVLLPGGIGAQAQDGGLGQGPREVAVADFLARRAPSRASGFLGTRDQTPRGDNILPPGEAGHVVAFVAPHEAAARAHTGPGLPQLEGGGSMGGGRLDDRAFSVAQQWVVRGDQGQVDCDALVYGGISTAFGHALTVRCVGELLANLGEVVVAIGMLDMGQ